MKIINAGYEFVTPMNEIGYQTVLKRTELIGRTCYKSEDKITNDSAEKFVRMLINRGHEAMIEHCSFTIKFIVDRGVSHEIVRHRVASFAQESQRYCNYTKDKFDKEITFVKPLFFEEDSENYDIWESACLNAELDYFNLISFGAKPEEARTVLPNSTKTEIIVTMNIREWRHFFKLRTPNVAHPQMREVTRPLLKELQEKMPAFFDDLGE